MVNVKKRKEEKKKMLHYWLFLDNASKARAHTYLFFQLCQKIHDKSKSNKMIG